MKKIVLLILIVLICFGIRIGAQKFYPLNEPKPFLNESIVVTNAQESLLFGKKIDINSATSEYLEVLPGIGAKLAERIIKKRSRVGAFKTVENLLIVSGIGPAKLSKIRHLIDTK
jgi:competence protein ComEA